MGQYHIKARPNGILVSQSSIFPIFMGFIATIGSLTILFFWKMNLTNPNELNYWVALLFIFYMALMGLYLLFWRPFSKQALFLFHAGQVRLMDRGGLKKKIYTLQHQGLETLTVATIDHDGEWYVPEIDLGDGKQFKIGFGCSTLAGAQSVIDQILKANAERSDSL